LFLRNLLDILQILNIGQCYELLTIMWGVLSQHYIFFVIYKSAQ
jgi:hypothetical protein